VTGRSIALACAAFLAACGDATSTADAGVPGGYVLRSVDSRAVPALVHVDDQIQVSLLQARVDLFADLTFVDVKTYRVAASGSAVTMETDTTTGSYSLNGDKLDFIADGGHAYEMVWEPTRLTYYAEGRTFRYTK